jgi:uncharacterized protein (DUF58 family)
MNSTDILYGTLLDAVRGLRWPARRTVRSGPTGPHVSRVQGYGAEFTEYRVYRPGDPISKVDWKLYARTGRTNVRLSPERSVLPTTVVLDASASMAYPAVGHEKWEIARQIAVALASVAHGSADPVGVVVAGPGGLARLAPRARRGVVNEIARLVSGIAPQGGASLAPAFGEAARASARIVLITDFLGDAEALLTQATGAIVRGVEVHAVHIVAAEEIDPQHDAALVSDPEAPEHRRPFTAADREAYRASFAAWREGLAHDWRAAGSWYTQVITGQEPVEQSVRRIVTPAGAVAVA